MLHFVTTGDQAILDALGTAFQGLEFGQLRTEFFLGIHGVLLGRIGFQQGHLIVQDGDFHFGKRRGCDQHGCQKNQLSQLTHDALLQNPLSLSWVGRLERLAEGKLENLGFSVIRFLDWHRQGEAQWTQGSNPGHTYTHGAGQIAQADVVALKRISAPP